MKKIILVTLLTTFLFSCNSPDKKILIEDERSSLIKKENDSLMIIFDSLMHIKVDVPLLIDSSFLSVKCFEDFNKLARETNGGIKILSNSKFVTKTIIEIINNNSVDNADLMILIDKTGSMQDDIVDIKKGLSQILNSIKQFENIRLSVGTYGDKNVDGNLWYDFKNFENDFSETNKFINNIQMTQGGDFPESVYDGIYKAFQENFWSSESKRIVILIGDAPSLDSNLTQHTLNDIINIAKTEKINMNFYPIVLSPYPEELTSESGPRMEKINLISNIYPNPTYGPLSIELNNENELTIELIDIKGNIIKKIITTKRSEKLDLNDLTNGLFIIRAYDKFKNYDEQKIIINK